MKRPLEHEREFSDLRGDLGCLIKAHLAELLAVGGIALAKFGHRHKYCHMIIDGMAHGTQILVENVHLLLKVLTLLVAFAHDFTLTHCCGRCHVEFLFGFLIAF